MKVVGITPEQRRERPSKPARVVKKAPDKKGTKKAAKKAE